MISLEQRRLLSGAVASFWPYPSIKFAVRFHFTSSPLRDFTLDASMSYALSLSELVHPATDGSQSNPTAGGAAEAQTILFDPDFSYGLDTEAPLADKDSDERRSWIDGVSLRGEASDESEYNEIYGSGDDYGDDCATSNDVEDTRDSRSSEFAAATDKDQPLSKDLHKIKHARNKVWQHETLPLHQEYVALQLDPPSGERVSIEYNATQFMLGGLRKAGNRTAAPCEPRRVTDDLKAKHWDVSHAWKPGRARSS
ncbi:hypothetical protein PTI98_002073 [Pleurotus ostreatus]|nr:hypothetical protein PTI98_002073 [Pleurotus ostreatus]